MSVPGLAQPPRTTEHKADKPLRGALNGDFDVKPDRIEDVPAHRPERPFAFDESGRIV
jgi:hypothetical protein